MRTRSCSRHTALPVPCCGLAVVNIRISLSRTTPTAGQKDVPIGVVKRDKAVALEPGGQWREPIWISLAERLSLECLVDVFEGGVEVATGNDPAVLKRVRPRGRPSRHTHQPDKLSQNEHYVFQRYCERAYSPEYVHLSDVAS